MPYSLDLPPKLKELAPPLLESIAVSAKTTGSASIHLVLLNKLGIIPKSQPFHVTLAIFGLMYATAHGGVEFLKRRLTDREKKEKLATISDHWQKLEQGLDTNVLTFRLLYIFLNDILNAGPAPSIFVSLPFSVALAVYTTKNRDPLGRPRRAAQEFNIRHRTHGTDEMYLADPEDSPKNETALAPKTQEWQRKLTKIVNILSYGAESAGVAGLIVFNIEELTATFSPVATIVCSSIVGAAGTFIGWQLEEPQEKHMKQILETPALALPTMDDSQFILHKVNLDRYTHSIEFVRTTAMTFTGLMFTYTAIGGIVAPQNQLPNGEYYVPNAYIVFSLICAILVALNSIYQLRKQPNPDDPASPAHSRASDSGSHNSDPHSEPLLSSEERDEKSPTTPGDYTPPKHPSDESSISPRSQTGSDTQKSDEMKEATQQRGDSDAIVVAATLVG